ncbi:hypothetical protein BSLG_009785 [Batrachochytrium salamandrivorans]|nr:hypothetical protein BSLG_009785 [Batrachochytrium salamandrivorans]
MLVADLAPRKTKIVATLGPASVSKIPELILAGDLGGPKIRSNGFKAQTTEIPLVVGTIVILEATEDLCETGRIITCVLPLTSVEMLVVVGGHLKPHKGINVPDMCLNMPAVTDKDVKDATYMWDHRFDFIALSFVQHDASDIYACTVDGDGEPPHLPWRPFVISKIEKPQALDAIDDIIALSDGIMVARGDLGVEISLKRVPIIQKMLIHKANAAEKPVITATQMLESMINSPVPTRAEMSSICQHAEAGDDFMQQPAMMKWNSCKVKHLQALRHPIADAAIAAAHEDVPLPSFVLLYGVFPVLSTAFPRNGHSLDTPMSKEELYLRTQADVSIMNSQLHLASTRAISLFIVQGSMIHGQHCPTL